MIKFYFNNTKMNGIKLKKIDVIETLKNIEKNKEKNNDLI